MQLPQFDRMQRFMFDDTRVRGELTQLHAAYREVLKRHDYPAPVARLLGELMAASALLTATIKLDGIMSLELRGEGPISLLMAESNPGAEDVAQQLRAIARYDQEQLDRLQESDFRTLMGNGQLVITLDPTHGQRYQGIVALDQVSLAACLEGYFERSEQLPTRLWLASDGERAAGLLVQQLPEDERQHDKDAWDRIVALSDTISDEELLSLAPEEVLHRLFHEEQARVFEPSAIAFGCTCSRERFALALHRLGAEELRSIVAEEGKIDAQCHFCNTHYEFSAADAESLIERPDESSPTLH
ncbi:Hsp33 family molecular chaperone HslO [Carnimonas nigrificans]|uniref:Hsp33 family molecular chaperone HslO n=1 Tax=Carnimonas nigrificans TaxID=64323 RepID=UPI000472B8F1|nr:Hsp33 family molecular chaperone HslO [Carnimonas nigrificans]